MAPVNAPVPGPSSTTTGDPVLGTAAVATVARAGPLGANAPTVMGLRANSRRNDTNPASPVVDVIPAG